MGISKVRHSLETEQQQGYSEEGISLWSQRFRKALEIGVAYEWPFKISVESGSVQMREMAVYMSREGRSKKRKMGKVWEDRLENKGGGIQWNWIKTFWGSDEAFCLLWRISQQNMHFLLFIKETVSVHRVSKQEMTLELHFLSILLNQIILRIIFNCYTGSQFCFSFSYFH